MLSQNVTNSLLIVFYKLRYFSMGEKQNELPILYANMRYAALQLLDLKVHHTDIKSDNMLVLPGLQIKFIDFGYAYKFTDRHAPTSNPNEVKGGTMCMLSPERRNLKMIASAEVSNQYN